MTTVDKEMLLEWLKKEFYSAKEGKEKFDDYSTRRYYDGLMSAYQNLKFALYTDEIK